MPTTLPSVDWEEFNTGIPPELGLPKKFTHWRADQAASVDDIVKSGSQVYLLDAPTGSGKSLVGIAAYRRLTEMDKVLDRMTDDCERYRCIYLTRTIQLQQQVLGDFPGVMVKGRSNYYCNKNPKLTCDECPGKCGDYCNYADAKMRALHAALAVLNDAYYLSEVNGPNQFSGANMVVLDEVDSIESCLMDFIKFSVSEGQCKKYGLKPPPDMESLVAWTVWAANAGRQVGAHLATMEKQLPLDMNSWSDTDIKNNKEIKHGENFIHQMDIFRAEVNDSWILDLENKPKYGWVVTFKPVTVGPYCEKYLWRHGKRFLGMSGTILDPEVLATDLGIDSYSYRRLDSHFPVNNRLVHFKPVANLKFERMAEELPKLALEVAGIIKQYQSENVLVHAVSNSVRNYLVDALPVHGIDPDRILTHDTNTRAEKLTLFKNSRGLVMISPSFDRGVDLPNDECRCVIICKMPYLSLGDKQVKARLAMPNGQRWYNLRAIQTVMQMTGRAVRNKEDFCDTYILDKQFNSLLARTQFLLPKWWLEAIRREE